MGLQCVKVWGLNSWQGREVTRAIVTLAREAVSAPRFGSVHMTQKGIPWGYSSIHPIVLSYCTV